MLCLLVRRWFKKLCHSKPQFAKSGKNEQFLYGTRCANWNMQFSLNLHTTYFRHWWRRVNRKVFTSKYLLCSLVYMWNKPKITWLINNCQEFNNNCTVWWKKNRSISFLTNGLQLNNTQQSWSHFFKTDSTKKGRL